MPEKLTAALLPCSVKHRNAAGRILGVLERLNAQPGTDGLQAWFKAFNCNGDLSDIYSRLALLQEQYIETVEFCELHKGKDHRLTRTLPKVLPAIQPRSLKENAESQKQKITDEILLLLDTIAEQMPEEGEINEDDFKSLNEMLDELFEFVRDSQEFKGQLRLWLLHLIRMMKDGLCRYDIKGARGLRPDLLVLATELTVVFKSAEQGEQPEVPAETFAALRELASKFIRKLTRILDTAVKYAPLIRLGMEGIKAVTNDPTPENLFPPQESQ